MSLLRAHRRGLTTTAVVLAVGAIAGAAFAFWSAPGSGTGGGASGTTAAVTLTPGTPTPGLYPGGSTSIVLDIANPNPTVVTVETLRLDPSQGVGGFGIDAGHPGCDPAALTYSSPAGSGWSVPGRSGGVDGSVSITLADALAMSADAADACQGASITVHLRAGT